MWTLAVLAVLALIAVVLSIIGQQSGSYSVPHGGATQITDSYQAFDNGDLDGAIAVTNNILSSNPDEIQALLAKASALAQKGSLEFKEQEYGMQAIAAAQQVLALDPNNSEAWRIIGYANEIMQNYSAAHDAYNKSMALNPQNSLAVSGDAHAWDLQGDMDKAEAGYRRALSLGANNAAAKVGLARVLVYEDKLDEALQLYISVANAPGNTRQRADAAYSAGQIEEMQSAYADAEAHFRSATTLDANYALGWTGLASELFRQAFSNETQVSSDQGAALVNEFLADLQKAIALNPNQSLAHYQLALEMLVMGRRDDALLVLKGLQKQIIGNDITLSAPAKKALLEKVTSAIKGVSAMPSSK